MATRLRHGPLTTDALAAPLTKPRELDLALSVVLARCATTSPGVTKLEAPVAVAASRFASGWKKIDGAPGASRSRSADDRVRILALLSAAGPGTACP